jgi:hypothetical protein
MAVARGYDAVRQALPLRGAGALAITQEAWARPALRLTGAGQVGQPDRQRGKKWGEVRPGARV